jgi:hypothetical protein
MSPLLVVLAALALVYLLSQFGGRLAARSALVWWLVVGLFLLSAVVPQALRPIADALGIEFVSNLVLASMVVFLLYQMVEQIGVTTQQGRGFRQLVSRLAAEELLAKRAGRGALPGACRALVVLPCYNEEGALPAVLEALGRLEAAGAAGAGGAGGAGGGQPAEGLTIDYCVVDDGSIDGSLALLQARAPFNHVSHKANVGVAGVLLTGFRLVRELGYDYAVQCDADGQHPVAAIPELVAAARARGTDLMIGSRFAAAGSDGRGVGAGAEARPVAATQAVAESSTAMRRVGGIVLAASLRVFGEGAAVSDPTSGFRVYSRRTCEQLIAEMPDEYPEPETIALVALRGGMIGEHRVRMTRRETGESSISRLGAGRYMVKTLTAIFGLRLRSLLGRRARVPLR